MFLVLENATMIEDKAREGAKDSDQKDSLNNVRCCRVDEVELAVVNPELREMKMDIHYHYFILRSD